MKSINKVIIIYLICLLKVFSSTTSGVGDLDIKVSVIPENKTKKYYVDNKLVLDSGVYNSAESDIYDQKIATITVKMQAKQGSNDDTENHDVCTLDSEFNLIYNFNMLKDESLSRITSLTEIKNYNKASEVEIQLKEKNFKIIRIDIENKNEIDNEFIFSAYPILCKNLNNSFTNIVSYLEYSFELFLDIRGINNGMIVGGNILIDNDKIESAIGSAEDLVKRHFVDMQS